MAEILAPVHAKASLTYVELGPNARNPPMILKRIVWKTLKYPEDLAPDWKPGKQASLKILN